MVEKKPLLSICIPTYNRAEYLEKSLESIIRQPEFHSDDVEVVISDNCSTDNTEDLCRKYEKQYSNFHYFRNEVNNHDKNFPTAMKWANGQFVKLMNDTVLYYPDAIYNMLLLIKNNLDIHPYIFFTGKGKRNDTRSYNSVDKFISHVSYTCTWIGGLGLWKDDIDLLGESFYEGFETKLWQVKILFDVLKFKQKYIYDSSSKFLVQQLPNKIIDYSVFDIFYTNYLTLCTRAFEQNVISKKTLVYLENDVVIRFFARSIAFNKYAFNLQEDKERLLKAISTNRTRFLFNLRNNTFDLLYRLKFLKKKKR